MISNVTFTLLIMLLKEYGRDLYLFGCVVRPAVHSSSSRLGAWNIFSGKQVEHIIVVIHGFKCKYITLHNVM